jgi:hypothetical protein
MSSMTIIQEYDRNIELSPTNAIQVYEDAEAMEQRIFEWFETPEGTMADKPEWGHNLGALKHEPPGDDLNAVAEMLIVEKMPKDIKDLVISGVKVSFTELDVCQITIAHSLGGFEQEINL